MAYFGTLYLDQEKDIVVELNLTGGEMFYTLRTPNHSTGNLITNLASVCRLPLSYDAQGLKVIEGRVPCYIDPDNRKVYILRLGNTKTANIYPDGTIERKAAIPAIAKTLMSQTKDYQMDEFRTIVKSYVLDEVKFHTDLHTHMNANLHPDLLIALGIFHQIRYPLYYIKKLKLKITDEQKERLETQRSRVEKQFKDSDLRGKYKTRRIDDNTFINFADLILNNIADAEYNIPKIRASLAVMKDGQAVFTNLEKVYLYRYVFAKGIPSEEPVSYTNEDEIPDADIRLALKQMRKDREDPVYRNNTIFQDKLLWIARSYRNKGIVYAEISDTTLVKKNGAGEMLRQAHAVLPHIQEETGVTLRFLAAIRRVPLTIVKDQVTPSDYLQESLRTLEAVTPDPYVAGCDIVGEEMNDIRDLTPVIREIVRIAAQDPYFTVRIHAGENDSMRDNVGNSIRCVYESLADGQKMPQMRIGHGLYTANLKTPKGKQVIEEIRSHNVILEFQITSNVRLNNLSELKHHPLKQYLKAGIRCVQGTDGGALYGTNSVDEQLSLERMLGLSTQEMKKMREAEDEILRINMEGFRQKQKTFEKQRKGMPVEEWTAGRIARIDRNSSDFFTQEIKISSEEALSDMIRILPMEKMPVVIAGGSFNNDRRVTRVRPEYCEMLDRLMEEGDPDKMFFVIGHSMKGYEKYLLDHNRGRYEVWAIVPSMISPGEAKRIRKEDLSVRVSIEPAAMGSYKSFAYEIFKRRNSVLIALDGNSAGTNMIQEAKNGKHECRTFVSSHCRVLRTKALSLEGYITLIRDASCVPEILKAVDKYQEG